MLPILYAPGTDKDDFSTNGLGFITKATKCQVTEERNGIFELEAEVLISDRLIDSITPMAYIKALPSRNRAAQIFEIYSVTKNEKVIKVKAQHIRYRMNANVFTEPYHVSTDGTPQEVWEAIQPYLYYDNEFTFESDISIKGVPLAAANAPIRLGEFMLGQDGSMLDTFHGEYVFDNYKIKLLTQRGSESPIALRCGAGISGFEYEADSSGMYTDIVPYAKLPYRKRVPNTDPLRYESIGEFYIYEDPISTGNTNIPYGKGMTYDFTQAFLGRYPNEAFVETVTGVYPIFESEQAAKEKLRILTNDYIEQSSNSLRTLAVNALIDTQPEIEQVQNCDVCDIIKVSYYPLNIELKAKVVKLTFDVLSERTVSLEVGSVKKSMAKFFSSVNFGGK